eukprot:gene12558-15783_t
MGATKKKEQKVTLLDAEALLAVAVAFLDAQAMHKKPTLLAEAHPTQRALHPHVDALPGGIIVTDHTSEGENPAPALLGLVGGASTNIEDDEGTTSVEEDKLPAASPSNSMGPFSRLPIDIATPPAGEADTAIVARFTKFMQTMENTGRCLNDEFSRHKGYRNPNLLTKLVEHSGIQETGSAFSIDVFHPDALPKDNYIDALIGQLEAEQEFRRKQRERIPPNQPGGGIEFHRGTGALGVVQPSLPAGLSVNVAALRRQAALNAASINASASNKRSKWDTSRE